MADPADRRPDAAGAQRHDRPPYYAADGADPVGYERLVVSLDKGELRYADLRKLRGVWLADGEDDIVGVTGPQGPDALGIDLRAFRDVLSVRPKRSRGLKATLMDQSLIAGLGNLLTDEICWRACVRPTNPVADLDADEVNRPHGAMTQVLRTAARHGRVPGLSRWLTGVRDEPDPVARAVAPAFRVVGWVVGCRYGVRTARHDSLVHGSRWA